MTAIELTLEKAITLIKGCIWERGGDYIYSNPDCPRKGPCQNWHATEDQPGCIIGLAMYRWFEELGMAVWAGEILKANAGVTAGDLLFSLGVSASEMTKEFLGAVQQRQDAGASWRKAFEFGLTRVAS